MRHLGLAALGADAARGHAHFPRAGPPAARLGLRGLFLRYGHGLAILHVHGATASARPLPPTSPPLYDSPERSTSGALYPTRSLPVSAFGPWVFRGAQDIERRPAGVDLDLLAPALFGIAVGPTARADAAAIGPAQGQQGQRCEQ